LALRRSKHAQKEIAYAANLMLKEAMHVCPITFSILMANKMLGDINE
jgi:thymidylate synthase ThyX